MSTEQRGIGSVEVGGQLLRVLTDADGPMMLRDLAGSAGMTAAKAHPYLVSFMRLGLIEHCGMWHHSIRFRERICRDT